MISVGEPGFLIGQADYLDDTHLGMTYELLLALLLALSPYLGKEATPSGKPVHELSPAEAVGQARSTCRAMLQSPEVTLFGVPLGQFIDEMIGSVPLDQVASIFAEDFKPKLARLGLDYDEAIRFYLSICHKPPSDAHQPEGARLLAALELLRQTRDEILSFLKQHPPGKRPSSDGNRFRTVFRLANGEVLYDSEHPANAPWIPLADIPPLLQKALIAVEDKQFYQHRGIDITSLVRAAGKSIEGDYQGGSTITQQLIKNLYYYTRKDADEDKENPRLRRKLGELISARELELAWGKQAVLEAYFNTVNFGRGARGVGAAAELLYGKPLAKLNLMEIATLAAMPKRPGALAYRKHFKQLQERQEYVLKQMSQEGHIQQKEIAPNLLKEFPFQANSPEKRTLSPYHHYLRTAQKDPWYLNYQNYYAIDATLSLHPGLQELAQNALLQGLLNYERAFTGRPSPEGVPTVQGAVVIMDNHSGDVLALQGGSPFVFQHGVVVPNEFDRATREYRQPGSTMKPFTYLMALESGLSPNTMVPDYGLHLPLLSEYGVPWQVSNYEGEQGGTHSMRFGLEHSRNLMTAWLLELSPLSGDDYFSSNAGRALDAVRKLSVEFGIYCSDNEEREGQCPKPLAKPLRHYPFILGAQETSLLRMVTAYARIANGGKVVHPQFIKHFLLAPEGDEQRAVPVSNPLNLDAHLRTIPVDPRSLFQIKSMLAGVTQRGTAARLARFGDRVAGKTGTSDNYRDAWFIGFTSSVTVGVWVGYVDQRSLGPKAAGSRVALPIFESIISAILDGSAQRPYQQHFPAYDQHGPLLSPVPHGLVAMAIDPRSGCVQEELTTNSLVEHFKEEYSYLQAGQSCLSSYPTSAEDAEQPMDNPVELTDGPLPSAPPNSRRNNGHFGSSSWIMGEH